MAAEAFWREVSAVAAQLAALLPSRGCLRGLGFALRDVLTDNARAPFGALRIETYDALYEQQCRRTLLDAFERVRIGPTGARALLAVTAGAVLCALLLIVAGCMGLLERDSGGRGEVNVFWRGSIERADEAEEAAAAAAAAAAKASPVAAATAATAAAADATGTDGGSGDDAVKDAPPTPAEKKRQ